VKTEARDEARRMRLEGASIREIETALSVSRSSASRWVRDIELSAEQRARLTSKVQRGVLATAVRKSSAARTTRRGYQDEGRRLARERDASYAAGCMLYWAEGTKARNLVELTNSDPELVAFFVRFLREEFCVEDERIRLSCNLFADHEERRRAIEDFWLDRLRLSRASLGKTAINRYSKYSQKKRANKLPYGTVRVRINDTRIVQTIYGSIQELVGFDRPEWLD
jgi:hypothetical protein